MNIENFGRVGCFEGLIICYNDFMAARRVGYDLGCVSILMDKGRNEYAE